MGERANLLTLMARSGIAWISAEFLFPPENPGGIALFFGVFDPALGLIKHGKARVGKDVFFVDFEQFFCSGYGVVHPATAERTFLVLTKPRLVWTPATAPPASH